MRMAVMVRPNSHKTYIEAKIGREEVRQLISVTPYDRVQVINRVSVKAVQPLVDILHHVISTEVGKS